MAHSSGFLGTISTTPDLGWAAMIMAWRNRSSVRVIDTSRQNPTADGTDSLVITHTRRIAGHTDHLAEVDLLLPDTASWAFIALGTTVSVVLSRKTGSSITFPAIIVGFPSECPLDGPNVGKAMLAFNGKSAAVLTT